MNHSSIANVSEVKYRIPYPVHVLDMAPSTTNPASHLTGKFNWVLKANNFIDENSIDDIYVKFDLNTTALYDYPKIDVKMSYDKSLLDTEGVWTALFNVTNVGFDDAFNISILFPLDDNPETKPKDYYPVLKDTYDFNTTWLAENILLGGFHQYEDGVLTYSNKSALKKKLISFDGWYALASDLNSLHDWDYSAVNVTIFYANVTYLNVPKGLGAANYSRIINITINAPNGMPSKLKELLLNLRQSVPSTFNTTYDYNTQSWDTSADWPVLWKNETYDYFGDVYFNDLWQTIIDSWDYYMDTLYNNVTLAEFQYGDFNLTYKPEIGKYFLEANLSTLAVNDSTVLSFNITNIPSQSDKLGVTTFVEGVDENATTSDKKYAIFKTRPVTAQELFRVHMALTNDAGRPLALINEFGLPGYWEGLGIRYTYEDRDGNEFFGISNGIDLQVGDDEAILVGQVSIEEPYYRVGDNVTINVEVENIGDIAATDITVNLVHGLLNNKFLIDRPRIFANQSIDSLDAGEKTTLTFVVAANSFVGLHPVFALITYTTDAGQGAMNLTNPFTNETVEWIHAGEAKIAVMSTMTFTLLLPPEGKENELIPAFPQPVLDVNTTVIVDDGHVTVEVNITNVGEISTLATYEQYFNGTVLNVTSVTTTNGTEHWGLLRDLQYVIVKDIDIPVNETVTIVIELVANASATIIIPSGEITYTSPYENELDPDEESSSGGTNTTLQEVTLDKYNYKMGILQDSSQTSENTWKDYTYPQSIGVTPSTGGGLAGKWGPAIAFGVIIVVAIVLLVVVLKRSKTP